MDLRGKNILFFGLGVSGTSALTWATRQEAQVFAVDQRPEANCPEILPPGQFYTEEEGRWEDILPSLDMLILSPGVPHDNPLVSKAQALGLEVMDEVELAYRFLSTENIIAVTGTSGKTTTATMIRDILVSARRSVFLGGNIGTPLCDYLSRNHHCEFIVLELSSFQLESMAHFRPHIGLFLNASHHHGERYKNEEDYLKAKARLASNMGPGDTLIYPNDPKIMALFEEVNCKKIILDPSSPLPFPREKVKIKGRHNLVNLTFALKVAQSLKLPPQAFEQLLGSFSGPPHRFEDVGPSPLAERVINDSKSTSFMATEAALRSLEDFWGNITLILGGAKRGNNDTPPPSFKNLLRHSCREIILQGASAPLLSQALEGLETHRCRDLIQALDYLRRGPKRHLILFSPAYPSFDQFDHYQDRGENFKKGVTKA